MKTEPNEPIQSVSMTKISDTDYRPSKQGDDRMWMHTSTGLTKREYFAAMAMQGLLADPNKQYPPDVIGITAVSFADALINALNENK